MSQLRRLALAVLVCALALVAGNVSAGTARAAETRVWGFWLSGGVCVGVTGNESLGKHRGSELAAYDFASGYALAAGGVVAEGATAPVGRLGSPLTVPRGTNAPAVINGRQFTGHALDQMQGRGLTPSVVEDTIVNGAQSAGREGATIFETNQARVILNPDGSVKTVMPFSK